MLDWRPYFENYDIYLRKILKFINEGIVGTPTQNVLQFQLGFIWRRNYPFRGLQIPHNYNVVL